MDISVERTKEILAACQGKRILVVGDSMLDRYIHGNVDRISPEAPVPVVQVRQERQVPGGASNVALNVATLGCQASLCACVGTDGFANDLKSLLEEQRVNTDQVIALKQRHTTVKTRIMADRQQIVRVDWDDDTPLAADEVEQMKQAIGTAMDGVDAVIVEDYGKGLISQEIIDAVSQLANAKGIPIGLDPKEGHHLELRGLSVVTPNRKEAFNAAHRKESSPHDNPLEDEALIAVANALCGQWGSEMLLITLGAQGMLLVQRDGDPLHIPTLAREVFDVSGAGDTVICVFMACLAAGAKPEEAAHIANAAAGVVVSKLGTATVTCDEILDVIS